MTFNLRRDVPADGDLAWPHRRALVAQLVREHAPDVLGTQEGLPHQLADLDAELPGYARVGRGRAHDGGDEACALHYRTDVFGLVASGDLWLSDEPAVPGSRSWGNRLPRLVTWATLLHRPTRRTVTFANTHLDHESNASRRRAAAFLAACLPGAVLMGDFNEAPGGHVHAALTRAGWRDEAAPDAPGTYHGYAATPRERIDWVLVPPHLVTRAHRVLVREGPRWPSDHHPVLVDVE
jgi:endonuclease/exonuclease/phosphatase family metal-dependent hydrolase